VPDTVAASAPATTPRKQPKTTPEINRDIRSSTNLVARIMEDLGFKIVKTNGGDELLARIGSYEICKAAFEKAIFVYPNEHLEMRQGARVISKSKEQL
jgi:hypothetical protein